MKRFSELIFLLLVLMATILMLFYPQAAYEGACRGLETWAVHLLPSLLPFFIAADLLLSMGFVRFLGVLLEPVMRPLFRLPGEAGFAVALGFTSGFPKDFAGLIIGDADRAVIALGEGRGDGGLQRRIHSDLYAGAHMAGVVEQFAQAIGEGGGEIQQCG